MKNQMSISNILITKGPDRDSLCGSLLDGRRVGFTLDFRRSTMPADRNVIINIEAVVDDVSSLSREMDRWRIGLSDVRAPYTEADSTDSPVTAMTALGDMWLEVDYDAGNRKGTATLSD